MLSIAATATALASFLAGLFDFLLLLRRQHGGDLLDQGSIQFLGSLARGLHVLLLGVRQVQGLLDGLPHILEASARLPRLAERLGPSRLPFLGQDAVLFLLSGLQFRTEFLLDLLNSRLFRIGQVQVAHHVVDRRAWRQV